MLTPFDPELSIFLSQENNRHLTNATVLEAISDAYRWVDANAQQPMSDGKRDLACSFVVRYHFGDDRAMIQPLLDLLLGRLDT